MWLRLCAPNSEESEEVEDQNGTRAFWKEDCSISAFWKADRGLPDIASTLSDARAHEVLWYFSNAGKYQGTDGTKLN